MKKLTWVKSIRNGRNSVILHSLRWFTQTTVERVTKRDVVAYYWIGKEQKNYQWEPDSEEELNELYNLVEPHLTFLDQKIIDQTQQKQIDTLTEQLNQTKKEILLMKLENVNHNLIEKKREQIKPSERINISAKEQYDYYVKCKGESELLKQMLDNNEIAPYQEEESLNEIEFDNEVKDRYNYYNVFPDSPYSEWFDTSGNLIVEFVDKTKPSLKLPPLKDSPSKYQRKKMYVSKDNEYL